MKETKFVVKLMTMSALVLNAVIVFSLIYFGEFYFTIPVNVMWALANIWLVLVVYANCFRKSKKTTKTTTKLNNRKVVQFR